MVETIKENQPLLFHGVPESENADYDVNCLTESKDIQRYIKISITDDLNRTKRELTLRCQINGGGGGKFSKF